MDYVSLGKSGLTSSVNLADGLRGFRMHSFGSCPELGITPSSPSAHPPAGRVSPGCVRTRRRSTAARCIVQLRQMPDSSSMSCLVGEQRCTLPNESLQMTTPRGSSSVHSSSRRSSRRFMPTNYRRWTAHRAALE